MTLSEQAEQFVTFFKPLADANRLKIVGWLARKPQSVEELAANLGVSSATISHHLQRSRKAHLVKARVQSYYNVYALRADVLRQVAERPLTIDAIMPATPVAGLDTYSANVLDEYFVHGRLKTIPRQVRKREVVLGRLAHEFEGGKHYSEKRVNEILKAFYANYATLRRKLANLRLLARERVLRENVVKLWSVTPSCAP